MSRSNRSKNDTWTRDELESELKNFKESSYRRDKEDEEDRQRQRKVNEDEKGNRHKNRDSDEERRHRRKNHDDGLKDEKRHQRRDKDEDDDEREERRRRRKEEKDKDNNRRDEDDKEREERRRRRREREEKEKQKGDDDERRHNKIDREENNDDREERRRRRKDREEREKQKDEKLYQKNEIDDKHENDDEKEERRRRRREREEYERKKQEENIQKKKDEDEEHEERRRRREERKKLERELHEQKKREIIPEPMGEESQNNDYDLDFDEEFEQNSVTSDKSIEKEVSKKRDPSKHQLIKEHEPLRTFRPARIPTENVIVYKTQINYNNESKDRQRRRSKDLMKMIELDKKAFTLIDLNPEEMNTIYSSHLKHAKCQTSDDKEESEMQTDDIDKENKWTQQPSEDSSQVCGGDKLNIIYDDILSRYKIDIDNLSLNRFLSKASNLILNLLNEKKDNEIRNLAIKNSSSELKFANDCFNLRIPKMLSKSRITNCHFCENKQELVTASFNLQTEYGQNSVFVVWNINEPSSPQKFLYLEGVSTSCCFFADLVFSGNLDGSVCLWDTREPDSLHQFNSIKTSSKYILRSPTYSTAGVLKAENHSSEVKCIKILQNEIKTTSDGALFMQLASLELDNSLIIWTVVEITESDFAGSNIDLGLLPGGRVKLVKSSSINLVGLARTTIGRIGYQTKQFSYPKNDMNNFYITTDIGQIIHVSRDGSLCTPSSFKSELTSGILEVRCLVFHHELPDICIAGYGNGELRLYHIQHREPLNRWLFSCETNSIEKIEWIKSKTSSALVIDSQYSFYIWDFLVDDTKPILKSTSRLNEIANIALSSITLINDKQESIKSSIVVCDSKTNEIIIHNIKTDYLEPNKKEKKHFEKLIKSYRTYF